MFDVWLDTSSFVALLFGTSCPRMVLQDESTTLWPGHHMKMNISQLLLCRFFCQYGNAFEQEHRQKHSAFADQCVHFINYIYLL